MTKKRDSIYGSGKTEIGSFRFDQRVADVFDDMIARSVPGYAQILALLPTLTRAFTMPGKHYYDLGCSTGAGLIAMSRGLAGTPASLVGIDTSPPMLDEARANLARIKTSSDLSIRFQEADITQVHYQPTALCLLNFTLQFVPIEQRSALLQTLYHALEPGGALVLSEKLASSRPEVSELLTRVHHQFKADQGYSELEISQKRDAIENVLIPETLTTHLERLELAGFSTITPWIRNLQFVSILAVK